MKTWLLVLTFCSALQAWSQSAATKKDIDELKELLKKMESSSETEIGTFYIQAFALVFPGSVDIDYDIVKTYKDDILDKINIKKDFKQSLKATDSDVTSLPVKPKALSIDSVRIALNEGVIEYLKVYLSDESYYFNTNAPIQILTIDKRFKDKLINPSNGSYIFLKDVLLFDARRRFNYFPDTQEITLKNQKDSLGNIIQKGSKTLFASNGINSLVNLQIYSDLLGVFGNKPNGLLQFEANSKLFLHRGNYCNKYIFKPFDAIEPYFHFSRIDSQFDSLIVSSEKEVNRLELFRRYTYATGLDANLVRADWRPSNSFECKIGYMYSSSDLTIGSEKVSFILHTPYTEVVLRNKKLDNFGVDLRFRYLFQKMNPNKFIDNDEWNQLISFRASVSYFPNQSKPDKVFVRFINYINYSDRREDFALLQVGYNKSISFKD